MGIPGGIRANMTQQSTALEGNTFHTRAEYCFPRSNSSAASTGGVSGECEREPTANNRIVRPLQNPNRQKRHFKHNPHEIHLKCNWHEIHLKHNGTQVNAHLSRPCSLSNARPLKYSQRALRKGLPKDQGYGPDVDWIVARAEKRRSENGD
jgi:hypothetical protein